MSDFVYLDNSEICYIYDGSFDGLLTVIHTAVYSRVTPAFISTDKNLQISFNTRYREVKTNPSLAKRVYDAAYKKIGAFGMRRLYYVFLSCDPQKDILIYKYMMLGFKNGEIVNSALSDDTVSSAFQIAATVSRETEKFREFTRFSVMTWGVQYAKIAPNNNILPILMPFFIKRLKIIPFVLHDVTHNLCGVYDTKEWHISSSEGLRPPEKSDREEEVEKLWKVFFDSVAIKERENTKLQKQNMPSRYFKSAWSVR
ncbi:MAG: DNA metabolism protein [Ruminococcaceae bacterium]|nr:DNA metabolism protein [Oscillospiraceae bacterium]